MNAVTGAPVGRALVSVRCFGIAKQGADDMLTDAAGAFRFTGLPASRCMLSAKRPGFEDESGTEDGKPLITVGPSRENLRIAMKPVTVITGRVLDRSGEPVAGVRVQALRWNIVDGRRETEVYAWATTDDRGHYRLYNLWRGPFYVRAVGSGGRTRYTRGATLGEFGEGQSFAPVYYSGAPDMASATVIPASPGEEVHADLTITREPGYRIRGNIGGYIPNRAAEVELLRGKDDFATGRVLLNSATGEFEIHDVMAGSYLLRITQGKGEQRTRAVMPVQIAGASVTGLRPELAPGVDVVFEFHGDSQSQISPGESEAGGAGGGVQLRAEDDGNNETLFGRPDPGGATHVKNVFPGRYFINIQPFGGYVASIVSGTRDVTDTAEIDIPAGVAPDPVEVTLRSDGGSVEGTVTSGGQTVSSALLILIPTAHTSTLLGPEASDPQGHFTFDQVPPGAYSLWVWRDKAGQVEYRNPAALEAMGLQPVSVQVDANAKQSVEVHLPEEGK